MLKLLNEAIEKYPNNHSMIANRSSAYNFLKLYELALEDCEKAI